MSTTTNALEIDGPKARLKETWMAGDYDRPEYVLHYLGRYTHRVAISNHRLVSFDHGQVTFRWRDSAHNNEQKC